MDFSALFWGHILTKRVQDNTVANDAERPVMHLVG